MRTFVDISDFDPDDQQEVCRSVEDAGGECHFEEIPPFVSYEDDKGVDVLSVLSDWNIVHDQPEEYEADDEEATAESLNSLSNSLNEIQQPFSVPQTWDAYRRLMGTLLRRVGREDLADLAEDIEYEGPEIIGLFHGWEHLEKFLPFDQKPHEKVLHELADAVYYGSSDFARTTSKDDTYDFDLGNAVQQALEDHVWELGEQLKVEISRQPPPNLRGAEDSETRCLMCKYYKPDHPFRDSGTCIPYNYPVVGDQLCDDFYPSAW